MKQGASIVKRVSAGSRESGTSMGSIAYRASVLLALVLLASCADLPPAAAPAVAPLAATIRIDVSATRQAYFGFGSTHSHAVLTDGRMTDDQWRRAVVAITSQIGAGTGTAPPPVEARNRVARPEGDGFSKPLSFEGVEALFGVFGRHSAIGIGDIVPFVGANTRWAHRWLNDLKSVDYSRYLDEIAAKALATIADWTARSGREPDLLQLWNEPVTGNRELEGATVADLVAIIKHTGRRLRAAGYSKVRFLAGNEETAGAALQHLQAIAKDKEARGYLGAVGYHAYPYGSDYSYIPRLLASRARGEEPPAAAERRRLRALSRELGVPVWMTEVSNGYSPGGPRARSESNEPDGIDWIVGRSVHIHDEFRFAGASAYFGMLAVWTDYEDANHFPGGGARNLRTQGDHLVLVDTAADEVIVTGMGRAIGHYARWLAPGALYLEGRSSSPYVLVSPFLDRGHLVVVLINTSKGGARVNVQIENAAFAGPLAGEQTRAGAAWQALLSASVQGEMLTLDLPGWSVTSATVALR